MKKIAVIVFVLFLPHYIIGQESFNEEHFITIFSQGLEFYSSRNLDEALKSYTTCLDMLEQYATSEEKNDTLHLYVYHELGKIYNEIGEYRLAENYYLKGIELCQLNKLENVPSYRFCLMGCNLLYTSLHDYDKALKYGMDAKHNFEINKDLGINYAACIYNIGLTALKLEKLSTAKIYLNTAKNIYHKYSNNTNNFWYSPILNSLAVLYTEIGEYELSQKHSFENIEFCRKNNFINTGEYAVALNQIGLNYFWKNEYEKAEEYFYSALSILEPLFGTSHQLCLTIYSNLAFIYITTKDDRLCELAEQITEIAKQNIDSYFQFLSIKQREYYWDRSWSGFNYAYMAALNNPSFKTNTLLYDNVLYMQGLLLRSQNTTRRAIYESDNQELIESYEHIASLYEQIGKATSPIFQDSIQIEIENWEKRIAGKMPPHLQKEYSWKDVQSSLKKKEAAIEFLTLPLMKADRSYPITCAALIIRKDSEYPELIPLCTEKELKSFIMLDSLANRQYIDKLYNNHINTDSIGYKLYQTLWKPLDKHLRGTKTIYYSLSDMLNRINFQALPAMKGRLIDAYNLHLVSSTSEIFSIKNQKQAKISTAVVYGGISYDALTDSLLLATQKYHTSEELSEAFFRDENPERKGWDFLHWTGIEADAICSELSKRKVCYQKIIHHYANEESFKALNNTPVDIIHLATHGYYLSDKEKIASNKFLQTRAETSNDDIIDKMLRTGLLMAGSNRAWMGKNIIPEIEDGILTAEEITRINLNQTKLVALSACNTGLGDTSITEGVFGLQRAFKLAGVESIIMSLWSVPDETTCLLMIEFYKKWLSGKKTKQQALKEAQQYIRKLHPEPYYWAGFVLLD